MKNQNSASVTLYKETLVKNCQVAGTKTARFKWGKTTSDVTSRRDIPYSAKTLMDAFSEHGKGKEIVALSNVFLAEAIGGERRTVAVALRTLENARLIEKSGEPSGHEQIQAYRMLHPALVRTERKIVVENRPNLAKCLKCKRDCVPRKNGWCLRCAKDVDLDGRVGRKVTKALADRGIA